MWSILGERIFSTPIRRPDSNKTAESPCFALLLLSPNHLYDVCLVYDLDSMQCLSPLKGRYIERADQHLH
jgi:hypothetical protein